MLTFQRKRTISVVILILFILLITKGLKFSGWGMFPILAKIRYMALFLLPICTMLVYKATRQNSIMYNRKIVLYLIFSCLLTFSFRLVIYGGGLGYGMENNLFVSFVFCCYFIFHNQEIRETDLILSLSIIGLAVLGIQIYQQLNPQMAMFSMYTEDMREKMGLSHDYISGMRNGLYRFMPIAQHVPYFLFCYYLSKLLSKFKLSNLLLTASFAVSTYLMLTRMFLACMGIASIVIYFSQKEKIKSKFGKIAIASIVLFLLSSYSDILFHNLFSSQESDIEHSSSVRLNALPFILNQSLSNPILLIFGHGYPSQLWEWGAKLGYWYNDLGVLGQIYPYGILWIIIYFRIVHWILIKKKHQIPIYLRAYVLGLLCICFMMPSYANGLVSTLLWCMVLYISDLYISNSNKTEHNMI